MAGKSFKVKLGEGFVQLPFDVRKEFGKARPPVNVSINGYTYRSTVAVYGQKYFVPVRRDRREAARAKVGDVVSVRITLDTKSRRVEPPPDLKAALKKNAAAKATWERLSYTHKREFAEVILQAKKHETRARRVQKTLEELIAKAG